MTLNANDREFNTNDRDEADSAYYTANWLRWDMNNVLLTGATGFLGSFLARELLDRGYRIFALARGKGEKSAKERVHDALRFVYEKEWKARFISDNVEVIEGDITSAGLGIKREVAARLKSETDIIIHSAALAELRVPLQKIRKINVGGTRNVLDFALACQKTGRLKKVNHISTMYVCGDYRGRFDETKLDVGQKFHNTYEQSKFEAEVLVRKYQKRGLNISIFRPSLIIGDSINGKTNFFQNIYKILHLFYLEIFNEYPINLNSMQNLVNVDTVARAIALLGDKKESQVYHLVSPRDIKWDFFVKVATDYFDFRPPKCISAQNFDFDRLTPIQRILIEPLLPYFNYKAKFLSTKTRKVLDEFGFRCPKLDQNNLEQIFRYCIESRFIRTR